MRKLIAGFKTSVDGKIEGPDGFADWVEAWSEDYGLSSQIDACLLGGAMYPGYEAYWSSMQQNDPNQPLPMTGKLPIPAELEWARTARVRYATAGVGIGPTSMTSTPAAANPASSAASSI